MRLVVEVGRTRSEQAEEDRRDGNGGAGALRLGNGGYGAPTAVAWCRLGEGAGEGRRSERAGGRMEDALLSITCFQHTPEASWRPCKQRGEHAACSSVDDVGTVHQIQNFNSTSKIRLKA